MNQADFEAMMADASQATPGAAPLAEEIRPDGTAFTEPPREEPGLGDPQSLESLVGGGLKSVFETKDFLFGETPEEDRSAFRTNVEKTVDLRRDQSLLDGFSSGIGQFATGMVGLGKVTKVAKALPWFGKGLGMIVDAAPKTAEAVKAATVGAMAFDPHEERLSNLVQNTPLANPVTGWLAADPSDSAAEGRMKAALESIGLDAAIVGVFLGSTKTWKALRMGNAEEASRQIDLMEHEARAATEEPMLPSQAEVMEPEIVNGKSQIDDPLPPTVEGEQPNALTQPEVPRVEPEAAPAVIEATDMADPMAGSPRPRIRLSDENTADVFKGMEADAMAISEAGGWYQAIEAGHTFGRGEGIPYVKLNADRDLDDFMARVVDVSQERLDALKGGAVLSDPKVDKMVDQMATLFNADPAQVLGTIHQAGRDAGTMVANMEAAYLVANKTFQDSYALAARISLGDFAEFGSKDAALAELRKRASIAASVYGSARAMTAASGRAVRRMRGEFKIDPAAVERLNSVDADQLVRLLTDTEGNPLAMAKALNPGLLSKLTDWGQFLLINNLVSGPKTQLINGLSNAYMVGARPLERILGSAVHGALGDPQAGRVFKEAVKQYSYIGTAFYEGFSLARKAFMQNDSVLAPQHTEAFQGNRSVGAGVRFKPWDSPASLLNNALAVATTAIGLPTRTLGFVDEAVKQTVYRSKVMATAHMDAIEQGLEAGLQGDALASFVKSFVRDKSTLR